ncbi:MAG: RecT family recombinase [Gammaproteobacteria bacterium]
MGQEISITNQEQMSSILAFAKIMSTSICTIPKHFHGKEGDCMAVIMQAARWGMDPYQVASKTHVVSGNLGYEAQLVNAVVSSSDAITGRFHYEYSGGEWKDSKDTAAWVRVGAILKGEDEIQWGERLYPSKVTIKNSPLWASNPKQQSGYLAIKYWARLYAPAVLLGVYTPDEMHEKAEREINPTAGKTSSLNIPVDTETGEIIGDELKSFAPKEETRVPDLSDASVDDIKTLIDDCELESNLNLIGIGIANLETFSLEEIADLRSHFNKRLKMMRMA